MINRIIVRTTEGTEEPLYDTSGVKIVEEVNGEQSLSFLVFNSERNSHAYPLVKEENIVEYKGVEYRIKKTEERNVGNRSAKVVTAHHTLFDLIDVYVYEVISGNYTLKLALDFILEGTGYTYTITDVFSEVTLEEFGDDNVLALFQSVLTKFKAEFTVNGTHLTIAKQIGNSTDVQFRYKHNVKAISKTVDTSNLSTYIKGYGKLKDLQDVLSGVKIPYTSHSSSFYTDTEVGELATSTVGANFKFTFTGTGFTFDTIVTFLGGVWEFTVDGKQSVKISTYKDVVTENKTFEIIRGLEHKSHSVVVTFKGKDRKNPYTQYKSDPDPIAYLKSGDIIGLYRGLVGDERYTAVTEYTSPNASVFGLRHSPPVQDDKYTTNATLLTALKESLQDVPEVSIAIDFADLRNAGYPYEQPNKGDEVFVIYEPMGIDLTARIMRIETEEDTKGRVTKCAVTLANLSKSVTQTLASFGETQKRIGRILTDDDRLKYDFLDETVKRMTQALQSAQTELEFNNGIIAREKTNPNEIVLYNSQGIGISTDGGQSFKTALTAEGIVADSVTTGTLRSIIIEGVEIYGSMFYSTDGETNFTVKGGLVELDIEGGASMKLSPTGLYGYNADGSLQYQLDRGLVTAAAIGTSNTNVYLGSNNETRSVAYSSLPGDGLVNSYIYTAVRASGFYGNFWNFNPAIAGSNLYARPMSDGELRITLNGTTDQYQSLRASGVYANVVENNGLWGVSSHLYLRPSTGGEVRATAAGSIDVYADFRCKTVYRESEVSTSDRALKKNITDYTRDALAEIMSTPIREYHMLADLDDEKKRLGIIMQEAPADVVDIKGNGVETYSMIAMAWRALQQMEARVKALETGGTTNGTA